MADRGGSSSHGPQKNKSYKTQHKQRGGGGGGRGWGGGRGGSRGRGGGRGGGPPWAGQSSEGTITHLGRYRDDPLPDILLVPGISVTSIQFKERSAEREFIEALERAADELYPETSEKAEERQEEDDLEDMLKKELEGMSGNQKSKRFRLCRHEVTCVFYVNVLPPLDPNRLVMHLLEQVERTSRCPFKYVRRIVPIQAASGATLKQLGEIAADVVKKGFQTPDNQALKFAIQVNKRNSEKIDRLDIIKTIADEVVKASNDHKVDLENPNRTFLVEMYKNTIGLGVVEHYERFRKYNPWQLAEHLAKSNNNADQSTIHAEQDEQRPQSGPRGRAPQKHAARDPKAERVAEGAESSKRKVDSFYMQQNQDVSMEVEAGEEVETGGLEMKEGDEIIQDGRVLKMRKVEP